MASSDETMVEYSAWEPSKWQGIPDFAVKETLEILKKMAPTEYAQLEAEPAKKEELIAAAKEAASEEIKLAYEFKDEPDDIAAILRKHLPEDRYEQRQITYKMQTYLHTTIFILVDSGHAKAAQER